MKQMSDFEQFLSPEDAQEQIVFFHQSFSCHFLNTDQAVHVGVAHNAALLLQNIYNWPLMPAREGLSM